MALWIISLAASAFISSGCAARTNLGLTKVGGDIRIDKASGYAEPERMLDILEQQSEVKTRILLQQQLQEAILIQNSAEIERITKILESVGDSSGSYRDSKRVRVYNDSKYRVEIISGEFKGMTLEPFEKSTMSKKVPFGEYRFDITWENPKSGRTGSKEKARIITKHTNYVTIKGKGGRSIRRR